jgi:hypothetical protein
MSTLLRRVGLCAGALVLAFLGLGLTGAAQAAGGFCSGNGVDVAVDYGSLGGGVARGCAPDAGGKPGDQAFDAAGYPLQYVPNSPGFVCAVAGKPAECKMPGAGDPWWGVFWSDGTSGKWKTAMVGVNKLKVPDDGSVAIVWETGKKVQQPSIAAPKAADRPTATATPLATPLAAAGKHGNGSAGGADNGADNGGGFPAWGIAVIVVVLLGGGAAAVRSRRGSAA